MEHVNRTLSLPKDVDVLLRTKIPNRGISRYVADAVRDALARDAKKNLRELEAAYEEANRDSDRQKVVKELSALDDIDDSEGWEW